MTPDSTNVGLCVVLAIAAYVTSYVAFVLQKKGAAELPAIERTGLVANLRNFAKSPIWVTGFLLGNLQFVPLWAALSFGPMSLVTPMIGVGLLVLVLFSAFYLREDLTRVMILGIAITTVGLVVFSAASGEQEVHYTWNQTLAILERPASILVLAALFMGTTLPGLVSAGLRFRAADVAFGIASGFAAAIGVLFGKIMMTGLDTQDLLSSLIANLVRWPFLVVVVVLVAGNTGSMVLNQIGFQKGKAVVLAPVFTGTLVLVPALTGIVLFAEWSEYSRSVVLLKGGAMIVIVAGVAILSAANAAASAPATEREAIFSRPSQGTKPAS